ncbi:hypothetical protein FACS1894191_7310 [Clostridia bacterium]|nr:hypothetical protein FACS1894191_7310 [Clostridia bacterium]
MFKTAKKLLTLVLAAVMIIAGTPARAGAAGSAPAASRAVDVIKNILGGKSNVALPQLPERFMFVGGIGAWGTGVSIKSDGTFSGDFHDANMGSAGEGYLGVVHECRFSGRFTDVKKISAYEYSMKIDSLNIEGTVGEEKIVDGVKVITAEPVGFENADEFLLYLPGRNTRDLPTKFLDWVSVVRIFDDEPKLPTKLPFYGLYNVGGEAGFWSYNYTAIKFDSDYDYDQVFVEWHDYLFTKPSTSLSDTNIKALALAASALNAAASGNASRLHGTYGRKGAYEMLGFTNAEYYNYKAVYSNGWSNEHCFSIASKEIGLGGMGESQLLVAVVLRGTETLRESSGDWFATGGKPFYGYNTYDYFKDYEEKVWKQFSKYVSQRFALKYDNIKVLVTGHSLGGAAANLFAARFQLDSQQTKIDTSDVYAFTFGALNSIEEKNVTKGFEYIFNIFNYYDTYGGNGDATLVAGGNPLKGKTIYEKFGRVMRFAKDYKQDTLFNSSFNVFNNNIFNDYDAEKYVNHRMPSYVHAVQAGLVKF